MPQHQGKVCRLLYAEPVLRICLDLLPQLTSDTNQLIRIFRFTQIFTDLMISPRQRGQ